MIKGVYLNEMIDDCSEAIKIEKAVFGDRYREEITGNDAKMPLIHILLYGEDMLPAGAARITFGMDGTILFDQLCVLPEERRQGYGDFIMHMIFDKCEAGGAMFLKSLDVDQDTSYFSRYGFVTENHQLILDVLNYFETHQCQH